MTITSEDARTGPYNGNGVTVAFSYDFKVTDQAHLVVTLTSAAGVNTIQTITTEYSVAGVGDEGGGTITMVTAPASGVQLTITRDVTRTQGVDLVNRGSFLPATIETALDKLTQICQDLDELLNRMPRFPVSSTLTAVELPATLVANTALAVNAGGTGYTTGPTTSAISNAAAEAAAAEASATLALRLLICSMVREARLPLRSRSLQPMATRTTHLFISPASTSRKTPTRLAARR